MNYLKHLKLLAFILPLVLGSCNNPRDEKTDTPNIILILSDDQAWDDYSFLGHEHIQTPNIDALAQQGLTFTQGYVPASLCRPSLASLVTGLYPHQHKILGNDPVVPDREKYTWGPEFLAVRAEYDKSNIENFKSLETLPELLDDKGYISFQTGKWWEGKPEDHGFDFALTHGDPARGGRHGDEGLKIGREGMDTIFNFIDYASDEGNPFFLWYAPFLPHTPHTPPDSLLQKYLPLAPSEPVAAYWAMCDFFDYTCGQLLDYVDENGLNENTLVIYVCDNGWVQDENRPNRYAEPSKRSPFNTGVKTPIMFKWDGKIQPNMNRNNPVSSTDVVPTVLSLVGLEPSENLHGINVLDSETLNSREAIFGEIYAHDFSTIDSSIFYRLAITDPYKLILPDENNKPEVDTMLFNIMKDPHEKENLAEKKPEIVKELSLLVEDFWSE